MKNVTARIKENKLIMEVDLSKTIGPSHSGKTIIIGTSGGNMVLENFNFPDGSHPYVGLNVYKKA